METKGRIDPILVSVVANRFESVCKEIGETMLRTSRSPIFSEARDFVTGVFDDELRLVAQQSYPGSDGGDALRHKSHCRSVCRGYS